MTVTVTAHDLPMRDGETVPAERGGVTRRQLLQLGCIAGAGSVLPLGSIAPAVAAGASASRAVAGNATYQPTFLRFAFSGDPGATGTTRWQWQGLQGNLSRPSMSQVSEQFVYATTVRRNSDPTGITQCLRPADVQPGWVLRTASGATISRNAGDDVALDVGNPSFRAAAAAFLVAKCRTEGWSGILLDEVNSDFGWGWAGQTPAQYPNAASWQSALLGFVQALANALHGAGYRLAGNLGTVTQGYLSFCQATVRAGLIPNSEFFVAGSAQSAPSTTDDGDWPAQVGWLEWVLANATTTAGGTTILVHDKQDTLGPTTYGLCTFLLVDNGNGAYGADTAYSATLTPYLACYDQARQLGAPTNARYQVAPGVWRRDFTSGSVVVNSRESAQTYQGVAYAPTSGRILLGTPAPAPTPTPTSIPTTPTPSSAPPRPPNLFELLLQLLRSWFPNLSW